MNHNNSYIDSNIAISTANSTPALDAASALVWIDTWVDLPLPRRRDLKSAVASVVRQIGAPAGSIPLSPAYLRQNFLDLSPKALGVGKSRKSNILSGLRFIMKQAGILDETKAAMTDEWISLRKLIVGQKGVLLNGFGQFCSHQGIQPEAVTSATLEAFKEQLMTRGLTRDPVKLVGRIRGLWNRHALTIDGWPSQKLIAASRVGDYALPVSVFPDSFQEDLNAFGRRLAENALEAAFMEINGVDEIDDQTPLSNMKAVRQTTVDLRKSHARWAASALAATGVPVTEIRDLRSLVVPLERVHTILRFLWELGGRKPSARGGHVGEVLRMIAKYHAELSIQDVARIEAWTKPIKLAYLGMTPKNETSIREMLRPERERDFLELPDALMSAARKLLLQSPIAAKALALRAVAIEILTKIPLRLANLQGLRLDRHLQRPDPRKGVITHIVIDMLEETKNNRAIHMPVSQKTSAMIQEWVAHFRPLIGSPDCVFLFPHHKGGNRAITPQGLRDAIKDAMFTHVGTKLSPHQFRHLAARAFLRAFPGHYEEVRQLLGHASITTTVRHYSGIETESSARRFDEIVLNRRRTLKAAPKGKR